MAVFPGQYFPGNTAPGNTHKSGNTGKYWEIKTLALFSCFILCLIADLLLLSIFSMDLR